MIYNVCIVKPDGYTHSAAFTELAELIGYSLQDLGHRTAIGTNQIFNDATNIIIGCHLLNPALIPNLPKSSIILNTEQVYSDSTEWNTNIFKWASAFETWDYSKRNIEKFRELLGHNKTKYMQIGYHPRLSRIKRTETQDIDILFYGSLNDRRQSIINLLRQAGLNVRAEFGIYGAERDELISRAKVVLNLHFYKSEIFEIVRVFYLMTNEKAVIGEVNQTTSIEPCYLEGIYRSDYNHLVESCIEVVRNNRLRKELEERALATIAKLPQKELIAQLL